MFEETKTEGGDAPLFRPLNPVNCISFADPKERRRNVRYAMEAGFPRMGNLSVVKRNKIAVVGGGPSLNKTYRKISGFKEIISCGSAHDHVMSLGIKPTWHIECDPDKKQIINYKRPHKGTTYLIASRCHKSMFQRLKGQEIKLWHMWEEDVGKNAYKGEPAFICGATVVLSAIPLLLTLGYTDLHFFGFDSSFESESEHHAYPQAEYAKIMTARVGAADGKEFITTATWLGQAQQFEQMQNNWGHLFKATVHGNGLIAEMQKQRKKGLKEKTA